MGSWKRWFAGQVPLAKPTIYITSSSKFTICVSTYNYVSQILFSPRTVFSRSFLLMSHAILILGKCSLEVFAPRSQQLFLHMSWRQSLGIEILQQQGAWVTHFISPGHPSIVPGYKGSSLPGGDYREVGVTQYLGSIWRQLCADVGVAEEECRAISRMKSRLELVEGHWVTITKRLGGTTHSLHRMTVVRTVKRIWTRAMLWKFHGIHFRVEITH